MFEDQLAGLRVSSGVLYFFVQYLDLKALNRIESEETSRQTFYPVKNVAYESPRRASMYVVETS